MRSFTLSLGVLLLSYGFVQADEVKEFQTEKGKAVLLLNLVSPKPDCSVNPGPRLLPIMSQRPSGGAVAMQIIYTDVPASVNCPGRKVPSLALFYAPRPDFVGVDAFPLEVETSDKTLTVNFRITVNDADTKK